MMSVDCCTAGAAAAYAGSATFTVDVGSSTYLFHSYFLFVQRVVINSIIIIIVYVYNAPGTEYAEHRCSTITVMRE